MDSRNLSGLQNMSSLRTAAELAQFIYCCRWMSMDILNFAQRISALTLVLEAVNSNSGKRTRRAVEKIALSTLSWGQVHETCFRNL